MKAHLRFLILESFRLAVNVSTDGTCLEWFQLLKSCGKIRQLNPVIILVLPAITEYHGHGGVKTTDIYFS